jgi:hypothetical protein
MVCEHGRDRTLSLSLGLFGAPASQLARDRAARAREKARRPASLSGRDN